MVSKRYGFYLGVAKISHNFIPPGIPCQNQFSSGLQSYYYVDFNWMETCFLSCLGIIFLSLYCLKIYLGLIVLEKTEIFVLFSIVTNIFCLRLISL